MNTFSKTTNTATTIKTPEDIVSGTVASASGDNFLNLVFTYQENVKKYALIDDSSMSQNELDQVSKDLLHDSHQAICDADFGVESFDAALEVLRIADQTLAEDVVDEVGLGIMRGALRYLESHRPRPDQCARSALLDLDDQIGRIGRLMSCADTVINEACDHVRNQPNAEHIVKSFDDYITLMIVIQNKVQKMDDFIIRAIEDCRR